MKTPTKRLCIYPNDIALIKGISPRQSRNEFNDVKVFFKKEKHQSLTLKEYSEYSGLSLEEVEKYIA
jgi:hypothetical protein